MKSLNEEQHTHIHIHTHLLGDILAMRSYTPGKRTEGFFFKEIE